jgi:flagellar basal-body rod protein FlgB
MNETLDSLFHHYATTINLRSYRQEVLASNIANGDTPGYKARDFDFAQALDGALASGSAAGSASGAAGAARPASAGLAMTADGHRAGGNALDPVGHAAASSAAQLKYRQPAQDSVDGNTVDMDVERSNFANNAIHYEANLTQLTARIKELLSAMQSA